MIKYVVGDATLPSSRPAVIVHVVNDCGKWGAGFSGALGRRYPWAETSFRVWAAGGPDCLAEPRYRLGRAFVCGVGEPVLAVAHLCAQRGVGTDRRRVDYDALGQALCNAVERVKVFYPGASFHMPRIGCGLAGGRWGDVEPLIEEHLGQFDVTVYDLESP